MNDLMKYIINIHTKTISSLQIISTINIEQILNAMIK